MCKTSNENLMKSVQDNQRQRQYVMMSEPCTGQVPVLCPPDGVLIHTSLPEPIWGGWNLFLTANLGGRGGRSDKRCFSRQCCTFLCQAGCQVPTPRLARPCQHVAPFKHHMSSGLWLSKCAFTEMNRPAKVAQEAEALGLREKSVETLALGKLLLRPHLHSWKLEQIQI